MSIIRKHVLTQIYSLVINLITFTIESAILDYLVSNSNSPINCGNAVFTYDHTNFSYTRKATDFVEQPFKLDPVSLYRDTAGDDVGLQQGWLGEARG